LNKDRIAEMARAIKAPCALKDQELENSRVVLEDCGSTRYDRGDTGRVKSYGVNTFRGLNNHCTLNQIAVASAFETE
jgi:hypothetical protein